jgi:hypothetical protein
MIQVIVGFCDFENTIANFGGIYGVDQSDLINDKSLLAKFTTCPTRLVFLDTSAVGNLLNAIYRIFTPNYPVYFPSTKSIWTAFR